MQVTLLSGVPRKAPDRRCSFEERRKMPRWPVSPLMGPSFGWIAVPSPYKTFFDTIPIQDTREHVLLTGKCWCRPGLDEDGDFVHNAADGRERYEQKRARPH